MQTDAVAMNNYQNMGAVTIVDSAGTINNTHTVTVVNSSHDYPVSKEFNLVLPESNFTGRENELLRLEASLQRNHNRIDNVESLTTVVAGLGGIGKTQLVREYVRRNKSKYEYVIWINAEKQEFIMDEFITLAKDYLRIPTLDANRQKKNINSIVESVYYFFRNKNVLFVFDNVESMESIRKFLTVTSIPSDSSTRPYILFTSRLLEWCTGIDVVPISEWQLDEATKFVKSILGNLEVGSEDDLKKLVGVLQCFPLALRHATSYILHRQHTGKFTIKSYLKKYERRTKELLNWDWFQNSVSKYNKTLFTTWNITITTIQQDQKYGSLAVKILNTIAYFDADNIHRASLIGLVNESEDSTIKSFVSMLLNSLKALAGREEQLVDSEEHLKSAVHLLAKYSMISTQHKESVLNIHRVVQNVIKCTLNSNSNEESVLKNALILIKKLMKRVSHTSHAVSVFEHAFQYPPLLKEFLDLPNKILMNLITDHRFMLAVSFGDKLLEIFKSYHFTLEQIEPNIRFAEYLRDYRMYTISDSSLYLMYDEVYKMRMNDYGANDVDTVSVKLILGFIMMYMKKTEDATTIFNEVLDKYKEIKEEDRETDDKYKEINEDRHIDAMYWIGSVYFNCCLYEKALETLKSLHKVLILKFGDSHPRTLQTLHVIGAVHTDFGEHTDALEVFKQVCDKTHVADKLHLNATNSMGWVHIQLGNYEESLILTKKVHEEYIKLYGEDDAITLNVSNNIGIAYLRLKDYKECIRIFEHTCKHKDKLGIDNQMILEAMEFMAEAYLELKNYKKSLEIFESVYAEFYVLNGEDNSYTRRTLKNINDIKVILQIDS